MTLILVGDTGPFISTIDMTIRMRDLQGTDLPQDTGPQTISRRGWGVLQVEGRLVEAPPVQGPQRGLCQKQGSGVGYGLGGRLEIVKGIV